MKRDLVFFALAFAVVSFLVGSMEASAAQVDNSSSSSFVTSGLDSALSLAQSSYSESSGSTRVSGRGIGKLIGLAVAAIIGIGGFILRKLRGE